MIDKCINDIKPDLVIIGGDVYENPFPPNSLRGFFSNQMSKLTENKIATIIIIGNHDVLLKSHALHDLKELKLKSVKVIDQPIITEFKDHRLCLFPYSLDIEQKKITLGDAFKKFSKEIQDLPHDKPILFFGHFGIYGASVNDYEKDKNAEDIDLFDDEDETEETTKTTTTRIDYVNSNKDDIHVTELDKMEADYILMGDFHKHQRLKTKTFGWYTGSIEKTGFNEMDQVKGFMIYDSEAKINKEYGKCSFIEYPNCRPMIDIKGDLALMKQKFAMVDYSKYQGAIVRLVFKGTSNDLLDFSGSIEEFKKEICDKIKPVHLFINQKPVRDKIQEQAATSLEKEIMERGHFTDKDILNVLGEMVGERVKNKVEQEEIMKVADEIYKEVKSEE
jgi:DNA repair exonuclease SbcCD nuclease subunit